MRRTDTLIVGGGPAGTAAAIRLAAAGGRPLLVERRAAAGAVVCGGFLGWDALASLDRLGVDAFALGAVPIGRIRIVAGGRSVEARLPARAAGLSRAALDEALLARAVQAGATVERGVAVRRIEGCEAEFGDGTRFAAERVVVATGKHAVRGSPRDAPSGSVGLRASVAAPAALAGRIELHLFRGGYAGLLAQEDGTANLCLSVDPARLREAGGHAGDLLAALADEAPEIARLGAGAAGWEAIAAVPYGWRTATTAPGIYRVGDQAAVIASLAGDGIAMALASGRAAADAILAGKPAERFQRDFARRAAGPVGRAEWLRHVAENPPAARRALGLLGHVPWATRLAAHATRIGH